MKYKWLASILLLISITFPAMVKPLPVRVVVVDKNWTKKHRIQERIRQKQLRQEWMPQCRRVWAKQNDLDAVFSDPELNAWKISILAKLFRDGEGGCRKDPKLALNLIEKLLGTVSFTQENIPFIRNLIELYESMNGVNSNNRIIELKRFLWLHGLYYGNQSELGWDESEQRAFIAREDVWSSLDRRSRHLAKAYFDPLSPRYDPAKGIDLAEAVPYSEFTNTAARLLIEGQVVPKDIARAEKILSKTVRGDEEATRLIASIIIPRLDSKDSVERDTAVQALLKLPAQKDIQIKLLPYFSERLRSKDPVIAEDASKTLTMFVTNKVDAVMPFLGPWLEAKLVKGSSEEKFAAQDKLSQIIRAGNVEGQRLLDADIKRMGGIVEIASVEGANKFNRAFISGNDYPSRAIRQEEQGTVSSEALVGPAGRVIEIFIIKSSMVPQLDETVAKVGRRRIRITFPQHASRYVKVRLPDVQFRLPECDGLRTITAAQAEAIVVDGGCPQINY
jgi:TonB family protein